jgi:TM2 domain-containing membrane protein YozV
MMGVFRLKENYCSACGCDLNRGEMSVRCRLCLHNYHSRCWEKTGGCTSWGCGARKPGGGEKHLEAKYKRCLHCGEDVLDFALKCRYCRTALVKETSTDHLIKQPQTLRNPAVRKDPILTCLLNLVFPGAGYMYLGKMMKGLIWFIVAIASVFIARPLGPIAIYLWIMYDSTRQAVQYNKASYYRTKNKSL